MSNITAPFRFDMHSLSSFATNMIPFPRLHYLTSSMAPIMNTKMNMNMERINMCRLRMMLIFDR